MGGLVVVVVVFSRVSLVFTFGPKPQLKFGPNGTIFNKFHENILNLLCPYYYSILYKLYKDIAKTSLFVKNGQYCNCTSVSYFHIKVKC